jgi:hypothetical protein
MSVLQQALAQRRAEAATLLPAPCVVIGAPLPAVIFAPWSGGVWVQPWIHFFSAHHVIGDEAEQIAFLFAHYEITANGINLSALVPEIAAFRLQMLRELPPATPLVTTTEPQVRRLAIVERGMTGQPK